MKYIFKLMTNLIENSWDNYRKIIEVNVSVTYKFTLTIRARWQNIFVNKWQVGMIQNRIVGSHVNK